MQDLRVTLLQTEVVWRNASANRNLYASLLRSLTGQTDLAVLPEVFTSGFGNEAADEAETMHGPSVTWLRALAQETQLTITGSMVIRDNDDVFNRLLWARPDGSIAHYDKRHLFRMSGEHQRYAAGGTRLIVELNGWRVCPVICYDLRFPVFLRNRYGVEQTDGFDYDLLVVVANWPAVRRYPWQTLLRARAIENLACVVGVNRVGIDGHSLIYSGDSAVLDSLGQPVVECGAQPQVITVTLSAESLLLHRQQFPAQLDADRFMLL